MFLPDGLSWPTWHWWMTLNAAEQGTWASGIGSFIAAIAAVGIAGLGWYRDDRAQRARALHASKIFAGSMFDVLLELAQEILVAKSMLDESRPPGAAVFQAGGLKPFALALRLKAIDRMPTDRLESLDSDTALQIMAAKRNAATFNLLVSQAASMDAGQTHPFIVRTNLLVILNEMQAWLAGLLKEFGRHDPGFANVGEWLAAGGEGSADSTATESSPLG